MKKLTRREQQDLVDKIILEILAKKETIRWTTLEKKVLGTHQPYATSHRFRLRMQYLLKKNLIKKAGKGIYAITGAGLKYLEYLRTIYCQEKTVNF